MGHEHALEELQRRLDEKPQAIRQRRTDGRASVRHDEVRMGATHFLGETPPKWHSAFSLG